MTPRRGSRGRVFLLHPACGSLSTRLHRLLSLLPFFITSTFSPSGSVLISILCYHCCLYTLPSFSLRTCAANVPCTPTPAYTYPLHTHHHTALHHPTHFCMFPFSCFTFSTPAHCCTLHTAHTPSLLLLKTYGIFFFASMAAGSFSCVYGTHNEHWTTPGFSAGRMDINNAVGRCSALLDRHHAGRISAFSTFCVHFTALLVLSHRHPLVLLYPLLLHHTFSVLNGAP